MKMKSQGNNLKSLSECKKSGQLHQEGKDYILNDGDVMYVLFNI